MFKKFFTQTQSNRGARALVVAGILLSLVVQGALQVQAEELTPSPESTWVVEGAWVAEEAPVVPDGMYRGSGGI